MERGIVRQMRAVEFDEYGAPDVLHIVHAPLPEPERDEVLVRVLSTTVNGGEVFGRQGRLKLVTGRRFPKGTGIDFVGEIAGTGSGSSDYRLGERVWGAVDERGAGLGAAAEYLTTSVANISRAPRNLSPTEAVSLMTGGATALRGLRDEAGLARGERLLVRGASGGVGSVAVQIGRMLGAHVTALASPSAEAFVRSLGADEVIDYRIRAQELPKYDVVFDTRGSQLGSFRQLLNPGGRMVTIAFDIDAAVRSLTEILLSTVRGTERIRLFLGKPNSLLFSQLTAAAEEGQLMPVVDTVYRLEEIAAAHARLEVGGVRGKLVIEVARAGGGGLA